MAKAPADTVKYNIYANVRIDGVVEKADVVGALFGQSEGLLGEDLELRDLQKTGRIGRIEVDIKPRNDCRSPVASVMIIFIVCNDKIIQFINTVIY